MVGGRRGGGHHLDLFGLLDNLLMLLLMLLVLLYDRRGRPVQSAGGGIDCATVKETNVSIFNRKYGW